MDEAAYKAAWAEVQRQQLIVNDDLADLGLAYKRTTEDIFKLNQDIGVLYEAGLADPTPPVPIWPPAPTNIIRTAGSSYGASGEVANTLFVYNRALVAGNCVVTITAPNFSLVNTYIDAMMGAQGGFGSARVNARFVKVMNVPGGVGTFNCHVWYFRQGEWNNLYFADAPTYSGGGQASYDFHAYGNNVPGNIDIIGSLWETDTARPARFGGTVNCPIARLQVSGFRKRRGIVYIGGVDGGHHQNVQLDDVEWPSARIQGTYGPGCYIKGTYTGNLEDFSGGTIDLSGLKKVAA